MQYHPFYVLKMSQVHPLLSISTSSTSFKIPILFHPNYYNNLINCLFSWPPCLSKFILHRETKINFFSKSRPDFVTPPPAKTYQRLATAYKIRQKSFESPLWPYTVCHTAISLAVPFPCPCFSGFLTVPRKSHITSLLTMFMPAIAFASNTLPFLFPFYCS